jgi:hypothetical protein
MGTTSLSYLILGIFFIVYFVAFVWFANRVNKQKQQRKTEFFKTLSSGLKAGAIIDVDDVVNIYKGILKPTSEDLSYRNGLSSALREFIAGIVLNNESVVREKLTAELQKEWTQKITSFLKKHEEQSPYSDLPSAERNILIDISMFIDKNDVESVKRKTAELAAMIQTRNDSFEKIQNINKWSVPLTIGGFILTVVFGIMALVQ